MKKHNLGVEKHYKPTQTIIQHLNWCRVQQQYALLWGNKENQLEVITSGQGGLESTADSPRKLDSWQHPDQCMPGGEFSGSDRILQWLSGSHFLWLLKQYTYWIQLFTMKNQSWIETVCTVHIIQPQSDTTKTLLVYTELGKNLNFVIHITLCITLNYAVHTVIRIN